MTSPLLLAHGLGGRSDLPAPLWLAVSGAAAAVIVSFVALGAFWRGSRFESGSRGRRLPDAVQRLARSPVLEVLLRALGLVLFAATLVVLALGADNSSDNPGPTWFYVWFWVGLVPASLLLGPVWRALNPLRAISGLLRKLARRDTPSARYPARLGWWPAAASILVFVWLELVYEGSDAPSVVLTFIVAYALVHVIGGALYGDEWFENADGFEVYSTLLGHLSPFGRDPDGNVILRNPFRGLAEVPVVAGIVAFMTVLLGSTAFDGLTRTQWWQSITENATSSANLLIGTAGLLGSIGFIAGTYSGATALDEGVLSERFKEAGVSVARRMAHSLTPIAVGYTVAHYFSLLVFQGQAGLILASDPLATGANLFGTADWSINYLLVSTATIAFVQVGAIVTGHVAAVVAAHDRAMVVFTEQDRVKAQYPLLAVMVLYTCGGIALLVGT